MTATRWASLPRGIFVALAGTFPYAVRMRRSTITRAFTLVEILVVVSIIGILISLLTVGIQRAIETGKGSKDQSRARQLLVAWQQYANNNGDQCMPGYLSPEVQTAWKVKYQNQNGQQLAPELAQTYGWRLAPFLGYEYDAFLGYRSTAETNLDESQYYTDMEWDPMLPAEFASIPAMNGAGLALQPGFGYNAYYLGGWWTYDASLGIPVYRFRNAVYQENSANIAGKIVARNLGQIARSSEMIVFSSSALRPAGLYIEDSNTYPGAAWSVPPVLGTTDVWSIGGGNLQGVDLSSAASNGRREAASAFARQDALAAAFAMAPTPTPMMADGLQLFVQEAGPLLRYGATATVANADGSTAMSTLPELMDMRRWVNPATARTWSHGD